MHIGGGRTGVSSGIGPVSFYSSLGGTTRRTSPARSRTPSAAAYQRQLAAQREPTYFILAALQDEPLHGYAIVKRAQELSDGRVRLTTGTLYAALDRLTGEEMVRVAEETVVNGRARRTYELTERGLSALHEEAARLIAAARVVRDRSVRSTAATVRTAPA
ncbi:PadR family transcriptional regulator [Micromonospora sp. CA-259024]|uniref:PadR family transcriptional regulator n=1 Tax=Micromonospora sp. CA-259024 TaxID=3239965 RepID=UPI003D92B54B